MKVEDIGKHFTLKAVLSLVLGGLIFLVFAVVQVLLIAKAIPLTDEATLFGLACVLVAVPAGWTVLSQIVGSQQSELVSTLLLLHQKNTYLEHAAKILRHDMHSGINTYIPRGVRSLERRLERHPDIASEIDAPLRLVKEGLEHTQKVYAGVTAFTNLVKHGATLNTEPCALQEALSRFLSTTTYSDQVDVGDLPVLDVNPPLFCTALDNLIRNGLRYNDSETKRVEVRMVGFHLAIIDNGRGMTPEDFTEYCKPYVRNEDQAESGSGLGLNICKAILHEHGFEMTCRRNDTEGTTILIRVG